MFFKDFRRIKKLGKYLTKDKKTIYLILIVLLPVSFSGAIQPLLVGQADLGIVGYDVLRESELKVAKLLDLGFGGCHMSLAVKKNSN